jgi:hypothetical protein
MTPIIFELAQKEFTFTQQWRGPTGSSVATAYRDNDGKGRLSAKNDPSLPPTDASASPGGRYHGGASLSAFLGN